jgi:nucleoside-diphosphate-sugar epimerase
MKLFVMGGTGYIGSVVCERLLAEGHQLRGLARTDDAAAQLTAVGIEPVRGALGDVDIIGQESRAADGVVQITTGGFLIQAMDTVHEAVSTTDAVLEALAGTDKPYVWTGGTGGWMDTGIAFPERVITEADPMTVPHFYIHFLQIAQKLLASQDVRTIILSAGQLYGRGGGYIGPVARVFNDLRKHGVVHACNTDNAFTFVHVDDLADLYVLALNNPSTRGNYIGATDTVHMMDVARAVSKAAGLDGKIEIVDHMTMRELNGRANEGDFFYNLRASSAKARDELGWQPHRPGLIEELASLPKPLDPDSVYPEPKRHFAASLVKF